MTESGEASLSVQSLVRTGLLKTILVIMVLLTAYGYLFIDDHLEWAIESQSTQLLGAEVNIRDFTTGWLSPSISIEGLRVTDPDRPTTNWIEIDEISARLSGYQLLKLKYVVEDAVLSGVYFGTERSTKGWVARDGGDVHWIFESSKSLFSSSLESQTSGNILGEGLDILGGGSSEKLLEQYRGQLSMTTEIENTRSKLETARQQLNQQKNALPTSSELDNLQTEIKNLTSKEGSGFAGLLNKRDKIKNLTDRLKNYKSNLDSFRSQLNSLSSELNSSVSAIQQSLEQDQDFLRDKISLPSFNLDNPTQALLEGFVRRRLGSMAQYLEYARPYLYSSAQEETKDEPPRSEALTGRDYRYPGSESVPGFWLKKFRADSGDGRNQQENFHGTIRHLSTNPQSIDEPLSINFGGTGLTSPGVQYDAQLRNHSDTLTYQLAITEFPVAEWSLTESESLRLGVERATGSLGIKGNRREDLYRTTMNLGLSNPKFSVTSSNSGIGQQLQKQLQRVSHLQLEARMSGLDEETITIRSNLDDVLSEGLSSYLKSEVDRYRQALTDQYLKEYEGTYNSLRQETSNLISNNQELESQKRDILGSITDNLRSKIKSAPLQLDRFSIPKVSDSE
jgi:uncharacterized protein (TIGR03545 family)